MPVERDDGQCISQDAAQQKRQEQVEQIGSTARLCRPQRIHSVLLEEEGTQGQESKPTLVRLAWPSKILPPRGVRPLSIHRFRIVSIQHTCFRFFFFFFPNLPLLDNQGATMVEDRGEVVLTALDEEEEKRVEFRCSETNFISALSQRIIDASA